MRLAAVVAEYNPFHLGHRFHLEWTRRMGAERVAVILSGNFVQRGEPALFDKWVRARAALLCGADLVVELPLPYAAAGARRFARGAVEIAAALGADALSFGSECGDLGRLTAAAAAAADPDVGALLRARMKDGVTFALARQEAVRRRFGPEAADVLRAPNDALAVEYLAANEALGRPMAPLALRRAGPCHDAAAARDGMASASMLRRLAAERGAKALGEYVPPEAMACYAGAPVCPPEALETPLLSRLRAMGEAEYERLPELSEGIERRLYGAARRAVSLEELYDRVKTKRYTRARVRRLALAAFLGLREEWSAGAAPYIRVLGYSTAGASLLRSASLPVGASLRRLEDLGGRCADFARCEAAAGDQYALMQSPRRACGIEYTAGVVKV